MLKGFLLSIEGIEIFPIISLLFFVIFFLGAIWYVVRMDKSLVEYMQKLPLESNDNSGDGRFINE